MKVDAFLLICVKDIEDTEVGFRRDTVVFSVNVAGAMVLTIGKRRALMENNFVLIC